MINPGRKTVITTSILVGVIIIIISISLSFSGFEKSTGSGNQQSDTLYTIKSFKLPEIVTFAGERMPLDNFDTRESLEREILTSAYRHSSTILIIKRANRYLPLIEKILKRNNVPDDFKYLVAAESEYSNVVSPVGATGFWQIMAETGKEEGLEVNNVIDERYDVEKSTQFACDYFLKSYDKYGNWTLAAASYDGGRAGVDDQIDIQHQNNYYDLLLTEETARYIFRGVAYKLIINDPARYGFNIKKEDLYPELNYFEVKVDTAITDLSDFAQKYGTNYKMLKFLNPWLRKPYFTPKPDKDYLIKIPSRGMRTIEKTESVN
jgi:membrane-bound lytic murein transglycosylase D